MNQANSIAAVLVQIVACRVAQAYDAVRTTLRATVLLAGCPAAQARA
jgi:hypothetical protein